MRIGIVSDSHGNTATLAAAIERLRRRNIQALFHCGDVGGRECLERLASAGVPAHFVWGNMDSPDSRWRSHPATIGLAPPNGPVRVELAGKRIVMCHGHEPAVRRLITEDRVDYILLGHSHQCRDERIGRARIINPGALHRAKTLSCALLDLEADALEFIAVPKSVR